MTAFRYLFYVCILLLFLYACLILFWYSISYKLQGELEVVKEIQRRSLHEKMENNDQNMTADAESVTTLDNVVRETSRVPFLMLCLDLPPPPLFKDSMEKNIIPQVWGLVVLLLFM